jgi:hypothetical protein
MPSSPPAGRSGCAKTRRNKSVALLVQEDSDELEELQSPAAASRRRGDPQTGSITMDKDGQGFGPSDEPASSCTRNLRSSQRSSPHKVSVMAMVASDTATAAMPVKQEKKMARKTAKERESKTTTDARRETVPLEDVKPDTKKRGRPRRSVPSEEVAIGRPGWVALDDEEGYHPPVDRTAIDCGSLDGKEHDDSDEELEGRPRSKRCKKGKAKQPRAADLTTETIERHAEPLQDITLSGVGNEAMSTITDTNERNGKALPTQNGENIMKAKPAVEAAASGKATGPLLASQTAKAPLRVGLSKRSRIAPLLSIVRK